MKNMTLKPLVYQYIFNNAINIINLNNDKKIETLQMLKMAKRFKYNELQLLKIYCKIRDIIDDLNINPIYEKIKLSRKYICDDMN